MDSQEKEQSTDGYFVRYDFGIYSRYTHTQVDKIKTVEAFMILGLLYHKEKEIKDLFDQNGLTRFTLCHMENGKVTELELCGMSENR